jgi:outer membrane lipoprotein carrier protein
MRTLTILAVLMGAPLLAFQPSPSAAEALAARVQAHYATVRDFTADFVLSTTSPLTRKPIVERGSLKVKKPGRMRWVFDTEDRRQFIADSVMLFHYFPKDKYVMMSPLPKDDDASTALLFLSGRGNLVRDFTVVAGSTSHPGEASLVLTPKSKQADFERLTLEVDTKTLQFRGLSVHDTQGGTSSHRFTNLRENVGLSDKEFQFVIPKDVVIR